MPQLLNIGCSPSAPHPRCSARPCLAGRLGLTRQTVIAIEQDKYSPSLETAFKIALVFSVPLEQVFQYEPKGRR